MVERLSCGDGNEVANHKTGDGVRRQDDGKTNGGRHDNFLRISYAVRASARGHPFESAVEHKSDGNDTKESKNDADDARNRGADVALSEADLIAKFRWQQFRGGDGISSDGIGCLRGNV